jgi:hypothetical protein
MADSEQLVENETRRKRRRVLWELGLAMIPVLISSLIMICIIPLYVVAPRIEQHLRARAQSNLDFAEPCLTFFDIPYDNQTHEVLPFWLHHSENSLGIFIVSSSAKTLDEVTEEELRSKQHCNALGEDAAWIDVYIESVTRALPGPPSHSVK